MVRSVATLLSLLLLSCNGLAAETIQADKARKSDKDGILWYDIRLLGLEGQAWNDVAAPFDRFPAKAEGKVREAVWNLSRHSAGLCVRFTSDAPQIEAQWELTSANLAMPHMPATGVSGLDLYVKDQRGEWHWLANGRPAAKSNVQTLVAGLDKQPRDYLLYLPLYNGVSSVEIGLPPDAKLSKAEPYPAGHTKPIVFYGTSITQGGCASRPGMVHTAIIGRKLNCPIVNLGFSGNGQLEPAVGELLAEIDAAVYVLDCLPNLNAEQVRDRTEPMVRQLREKRADTPILLVEDRTYSDAFLNKGKRAHNDNNRRELKAAYERLRSANVKGIYYLEGEKLLGVDNEGTVDSSHPTDLGFLRQAEAFVAALKPVLAADSK
jgi:hypothetical protein